MQLGNIKPLIDHNSGVEHFKLTSECLSSSTVFLSILMFLTTIFGLHVIFFLNTINEQEHWIIIKTIKSILWNIFI